MNLLLLTSDLPCKLLALSARGFRGASEKRKNLVPNQFKNYSQSTGVDYLSESGQQRSKRMRKTNRSTSNQLKATAFNGTRWLWRLPSRSRTRLWRWAKSQRNQLRFRSTKTFYCIRVHRKATSSKPIPLTQSMRCLRTISLRIKHLKILVVDLTVPSTSHNSSTLWELRCKLRLWAKSSGLKGYKEVFRQEPTESQQLYLEVLPTTDLSLQPTRTVSPSRTSSQAGVPQAMAQCRDTLRTRS